MSARDTVRAMRDPRAALVRRLRRARVRVLGEYGRRMTWGDLDGVAAVQRRLTQIGDRLEVLGGYPYPTGSSLKLPGAAFGTLRLLSEVLPFERATYTTPDGRARVVFPVPARAPMGAPLASALPDPRALGGYRAKRGQRARRGRRR